MSEVALCRRKQTLGPGPQIPPPAGETSVKERGEVSVEVERLRVRNPIDACTLVYYLSLSFSIPLSLFSSFSLVISRGNLFTPSPYSLTIHVHVASGRSISPCLPLGLFLGSCSRHMPRIVQ